MEDDKDPPIDEGDYVSGTTVVDIGDLRVARGLTRRPYSSCQHARLNYDPRERRIWCKDCEKNVEPFDAFTGLVGRFDLALKQLKRREDNLREAEAFQARLLATREIEKAWRKKNSFPACPSCGAGLFPEDFKNGVATVGRQYAELRRKKRDEG